MPKVGDKEFSYTPAGRRAARKYAARTGKRVSNKPYGRGYGAPGAGNRVGGDFNPSSHLPRANRAAGPRQNRPARPMSPQRPGMPRRKMRGGPATSPLRSGLPRMRSMGASPMRRRINKKR